MCLCLSAHTGLILFSIYDKISLSISTLNQSCSSELKNVCHPLIIYLYMIPLKSFRKLYIGGGALPTAPPPPPASHHR